MELIKLVLKHLVINHFLHSYYSELKIVGKAYYYPKVFLNIISIKKKIFGAYPKHTKVCKGTITSFKIVYTYRIHNVINFS